jgi:hypothetical protein
VSSNDEMPEALRQTLRGGRMEEGKTVFRYPAETSPKDFMQQFVDVFQSKGWLNRNLRIRHCGRKYRIICSEKEFLAYHINENCGISPGIPGWPVCMVNHERIIEDGHMSVFESSEPGSYEWLLYLASGNIEVI